MKCINQLTLFLTSKCNMNCKYCYLGNKGKDVLSWSEAKRAIHLLMKNNKMSYKGISFFGGEPLLQKDMLFSISDYVRKNYREEVNLSVTTNGLLLDKEIMRRLKEYGIFIILSLDGCDAEANKNRVLLNGKSSWGIISRRLLEIDKEEIGSVRITVLPENVDRLCDNILGLYRMGFKRINFALDFTSIWLPKNIKVYQEQYRKLLMFYQEQMLLGNELKIDVIDNIIYSALKKGKYKCRYGCGNLVVAADGKVYRCHREVFECGIVGMELDDFVVQNYQDNYVTDSICVSCELYSRCTFCMINIRVNGGNMKNIPETICKLNKINILETDNMAEKLYRKKCSVFMEKFYM